jgi:hypothetical protein
MKAITLVLLMGFPAVLFLALEPIGEPARRHPLPVRELRAVLEDCEGAGVDPRVCDCTLDHLARAGGDPPVRAALAPADSEGLPAVAAGPGAGFAHYRESCERGARALGLLAD